MDPEKHDRYASRGSNDRSGDAAGPGEAGTERPTQYLRGMAVAGSSDRRADRRNFVDLVDPASRVGAVGA